MALRDIGLRAVRTVAAFAVAACVTTGVVAQQFVTDGLFAMYSLDEAHVDGDLALDMIGSNDGTIMGGGVSFVDGVINECAEFDATDGYIEIPALGLRPSVTLECWAMEHAFGGIQGIVSTWAWVAGKVHFKFQDNEIQVDKNAGSKIRLAGEANMWYHIAYTSDEDSGELKLYVNGELVAEGAGGANPENMEERRIGSEHNGRYLDGKIDEVRIYNRVLDDDEIVQNYEVDANTLAVDAGAKLSMTWGRLKYVTR
ncbi:MAG: LamG domain-containing protein [Candidatus Poribacteria bacterium]